jgi:hypothetical protein
MDKENLELVQGISRFYEMLWIRRDSDGRIDKLYDREGNELPHQALHRSFITVACPGGFTYLGEFIAMDNENEAFKRRALHLQRRKREHPPESYLDTKKEAAD